LRAAGYISGKAVAEQVLATTGKPAQIRLTADRSTIQTDGSDLCYITVEVLDDGGQLHPISEEDIYFTVKGTGKILAVGNGNPLSEELYVGNQRKVYRGRALVVVKAADEAGEIRLTAQADGLDGYEVVIKTVE
jgi:beta-galactosidase